VVAATSQISFHGQLFLVGLSCNWKEFTLDLNFSKTIFCTVFVFKDKSL